MREFIDELLEPNSTFSNVAKYLATFIAIILFGIYLGNLLFGDSSVEVLINLQNQKEILKDQVQILKEKNAKLQKEYFELKELEP